MNGIVSFSEYLGGEMNRGSSVVGIGRWRVKSYRWTGVSWGALSFVFSARGMEINGEVVLSPCAVTFSTLSREIRDMKRRSKFMG